MDHRTLLLALGALLCAGCSQPGITVGPTSVADTTDAALPTDVALPDTVSAGVVPQVTATFVDVSMSHGHTCAVTSGGRVLCWGNTAHWNGNGYAPQTMPGVTNVKAIVCSAIAACSISTSGDLWCWGSIGWTKFAMPTPPHLIAGLPPVAQLGLRTSYNQQHACAVTTAGEVACWGGSANGALGLGQTQKEAAVPTALAGLSKVNYIATG